MQRNNEQKWALGLGIAVAGIGLMGLIPGLTKRRKLRYADLKMKAGHGDIAGVVPTNLTLNVARIGLGTCGVMAAQDEKASRLFLRSLGGICTLFGVMGLMPQAQARNFFGMMPLNGGNVPLHLGGALATTFVSTEFGRQMLKPLVTKAVDRAGDLIRSTSPQRFDPLTAEAHGETPTI